MSSAASQTAQERALRHVAELASGPPMDPALRVTLNFHPDRLLHGKPILDAMAEGGVYHSQFVTGTSNGGLTAHPGGDRWRWESRIFDGAYDEATAHERPVYGALNFRRKPVGGAPRFGSAHFRLTAQTLTRSTFCYPDSFLEPSDFGVAARMGLVELACADRQDELDDYIEAQVHASVQLQCDVEALVLDPCYRGTTVEVAALRLGCPVEWHPGFRLGVEELRRHPDYRGQEYVDLGTQIAVDGMLDPRIIGDSARAGLYAPQAVKKVWHYLARFGAPGRPWTDRWFRHRWKGLYSMAFVEGLVPEGLWDLFRAVRPQIPTRPQGGGRRRVDDRAVLAAIIFVATSGCTWRQLPPVFGASWQTVHRRFSEWTAARVWAKLHRLVLDELGARGELDWSRCAIDSVNMRALKDISGG